MLGRDIYPDGILFFSNDSHYSLPKIAHMLRMEAEVVASDEGGEIDYDALRDALKRRCADTGRAAVLCCNVGTTMKGALDKPARFLEICDELGIEERHVHCDAALLGLMLPFQEGAPMADFRLPIGSMSFSGHKFPGSPIPCGIVLTRASTVGGTQEMLWRRENSAEYVGSIDTTISGSRDGISVLTLWLQLLRLGREGLRQKVQQCTEMVDLAESMMLAQGIPCYHHPYSNILVFPQPSPHLQRRWMLAVEGGVLAHIVLMPGTGPEKIAQFVDEIKDDPGLRNAARSFRIPKLEKMRDESAPCT
jgi:histidine decarboxylase